MTPFIKSLFLVTMGAFCANDSEAQRGMHPVKLFNTGLITHQPYTLENPSRLPNIKMVVVTPELDTLVLVPHIFGKAKMALGIIVKENDKRAGELHLYRENTHYFVNNPDRDDWDTTVSFPPARVNCEKYIPSKFGNVVWQNPTSLKPANK